VELRVVEILRTSSVARPKPAARKVKGGEEAGAKVREREDVDDVALLVSGALCWVKAHAGQVLPWSVAAAAAGDD
ncbi:unnamed protein product, partial [Urochloa humidicola]